MLVARKKSKTFHLPKQRLKVNSVPKPESHGFPVTRPKKVHLPRESKLLCGLLLCLIAISIGLISQYGRVLAGNYQLEKMRKEIVSLQEEKEFLSIEVNRLNCLERVESIALDELGLQYPEQKQWLVLSVKRD